MSDRLRIVVSDDASGSAPFEVQFQFSTFTLTLVAADRSFARKLLEFIAETKGNPIYRARYLGAGRYRTMSEKGIDLSSSFPGSTFRFEKDGEYDDSYIARVSNPSGLELQFAVRGEQLEMLVEELHEIG